MFGKKKANPYNTTDGEPVIYQLFANGVVESGFNEDGTPEFTGTVNFTYKTNLIDDNKWEPFRSSNAWRVMTHYKEFDKVINLEADNTEDAVQEFVAKADTYIAEVLELHLGHQKVEVDFGMVYNSLEDLSK